MVLCVSTTSSEMCTTPSKILQHKRNFFKHTSTYYKYLQWETRRTEEITRDAWISYFLKLTHYFLLLPTTKTFRYRLPGK